ncbi:MAG: hypothetical protein ACOYOP_00535 [Microthrixaceae bacterium]
MLHARLNVHRLHLDGAEVPLRHATLVAVARAESRDLDWEVVADRVHDEPIEMGRRLLDMLCITGADTEGHLVLGEFVGEAVVVRVVDRTAVFRGDGPLSGLDADHLLG